MKTDITLGLVAACGFALVVIAAAVLLPPACDAARQDRQPHCRAVAR
jgi:hypothetical protein